MITSPQVGQFGFGSSIVLVFEAPQGLQFPTREMELVKFGECVWLLKPLSKGKSKAQSRWKKGVWLGIREESGEYLVGNEEGVRKVRTVRRRGSHEDRWSWS